MEKLNNEVNGTLLKDQHQRLSAVIKGLHRQLRRAYRESNGDHASVWEKHTKNSANLEEYAHAMHCLATQHWGIHPDTRIEWCRQVALEYFNGGGKEHAQQRDLRRRMRQGDAKVANDMKDSNSTDTGASKNCEGSRIQMPGEHCICLAEKKGNPEERIRDQEVRNATGERRIWLLDVGSCYNPFQECPEFEALGIDLIPATESVYQCDFLKLEVIPFVCVPPNLSPRDPDSVPLSESLNIDPRSRTVTELPAASFQVIVFSLLLEYLPAAVQRWACCVKAYTLLEHNGLLFIVTPDSNSAHRNAPMMKSWRQALECLGFQRWKYKKMEHVHCMAYRKVTEELPETFPELVGTLLYIPQDFNDACYDDDHLPPSERGSHEIKVDDPEQQAELEAFLLSSVGELPLMISDEEEDGDC